MRKLIAHIYDTIREDLGHPATLYRLLDEQPQLRTELTEPKRVTDAYCVAHWHKWGGTSYWPRSKGGTVRGWKYSAGSYSGFRVHLPELENFGLCKVFENWECDIQTVDGLGASKSKLRDFTSLDDMAEKKSQGLIEEITEEGLKKNLAHDEIRILRDGPSDHFARYLWDGRIFLMNAGGSHHFAAARYIAARLDRPVPLRGKLYTYSINQMAVASLQRDFDMYVISAESNSLNGFLEAMRAFRASYLWQYLPRPYDNQCRAILLPKTEPRSAKVSALLREAGFFDLGEHLRCLAARQTTDKGQDNK